MCQDYYRLEFMDRSVDTSPIAPALAAFFDDVLDRSVQELNFKARAPPPTALAMGRPPPGVSRCDGAGGHACHAASICRHCTCG